MNNRYFLRITAIFLLFFLFSTPALASISREEYEKSKKEFQELFEKMQEAREATFWERHKWKIITGLTIIGIAIYVITFPPSAVTAPAVLGHVASMAIGSAAVMSTSTIALTTAGGVSLVVLGYGFTKSMLEKEGAQYFLNSATFRYILNKGITLTDNDKRRVNDALRLNEEEILASSNTQSDVLGNIDRIILDTLRSIYR